MPLKSVRRIAVVLLLASAALSTSARASQGALSDALVANELRALTTSVDKLVETLQQSPCPATEDDDSLRKLEIAIAYLNFRSRRIEMFEQDLQAKQTQRSRVEDLLDQFQREEDSLSDKFGPGQQEGLQKAREDVHFRQQALKDRLSRLDEEIILLQNRIMDMQSQIDSVESFVEKNLVF
ncbi:MAG: hypothetical protein P8Y96_11760 [Desulfuromonadales bacterium]